MPTLGMVTRREPYRRPVFEDPFFQEQVPLAVVSRLREEAMGGPGGERPRTAVAAERTRIIADNFAKLADHVILGTDAGAVGDFWLS